MQPMEIHLLGRPWVARDSGVTPNPRGRKVWSLLAFLLLADAPVSRERLATLLFGDADDPLGALRWNLAEVRRLLAAAASVGGDPVLIELPPDAVVDVRVLQSATWIQAARVPGIGQELLAGVDVQADAAFDAWLMAERLRVSHLSAAVLKEAASARLAAGDADGAVELATKLVGIDEFDEEAQVLLVRAHRAAGGAVRAQAYLDATVTRLERDLGVQPSQALRDAGRDPIGPSAAMRPVRGVSGIESLVVAGKAAVGAGVFDAGADILRRSVDEAREAGDRRLESLARTALGTAQVHAGRGFDTDGIGELHAALALAEEIGEATVVAEATRELGYADMKRGRYDRAEYWLARSVAAAPDRSSLASATAVRGVVAADRGLTAESAAWLSAAVDDALAVDKPRLVAWTLAFLGRTQLLREELDAARSSLERSENLARGAGWMSFLPLPQSLLATTDLVAGDVERAAPAFEAAFALGCQIADPCWEGMAARGIGLVHARHGRIDKAVAWLDDAHTRCMRIADSYLWVHAYCLDALCEVAAEQRHPQARSWIADLRTVASRTGMSEMLVRSYVHGAVLGDEKAARTATLFTTRTDNPAVAALVAAVRPPERVPAGAAGPA